MLIQEASLYFFQNHKTTCAIVLLEAHSEWCCEDLVGVEAGYTKIEREIQSDRYFLFPGSLLRFVSQTWIDNMLTKNKKTKKKDDSSSVEFSSYSFSVLSAL